MVSLNHNNYYKLRKTKRFMKTRAILAAFILVVGLNLASAIVVDSEFVTLFPGEEGSVRIEVENNDEIDYEEVSMQLILDNVPFTSVGSSEKSLDDLDEDDDDTVTFKIRPSTDINPGDYNIPYVLDYVNADDNDEEFSKEGSFGIRVSAKTELDFVLDVKGTDSTSPIVGREGRIDIEIINEGLGELKSLSIQIFPEGYELLSPDKIFVGSVDSDDTDIASFDVIFSQPSARLKAVIDFKDFDNNDETRNIELPFNVYTLEEAQQLGLVSTGSPMTYIIVLVVLIIIWIIWRRARKSRRKNNKKKV